MQALFESSVYRSSDFVLAAGSVLCKRVLASDALQVCLLYHRKSGLWVLPKGRKDLGETIEAAAIRETFEETGYACKFLPVRMPTRAPPPAINLHPDVVSTIDNAIEPFSVTVRKTQNSTKIIFWYLTQLQSPDVQRSSDTQTDSEDFVSRFCEIEEALTLLTISEYTEVVKQAALLLQEH
ncbi:NUDIX hydrolase domain-like protein [Cyathus striatus]|nr:NUDIX hydrolase domain-like protein [Cyathus striatus]